MRVLVIGGGIGGLCLAHGLRGAGVDVEVYERNPDGAAALAGFGLHVNAAGCRALRECLPDANWARFDATAGHAGRFTRFYDDRLRLLAVRDNGDTGERRPVSRTALHEILTAGLDGVVHRGREFTGYEHTADGRVLARFADGGHAVGDVLVGADGSNSRMRGQYLPGMRRVDLGILNIAGRHPLRGREGALPTDLVDGSPTSIVPAGPGWMFVSAWRGEGDDYVVWSYVVNLADCPSTVDGVELRDFVLSRIGGWAPALRALVRDGDPDTVAPVRLRTMPALRPWRPSAVTLLGDAIHNMTPMAGVGANTALRDAGVLRAALAGRLDPVDAIGDYERRMRAYANPAIDLSRRNAERAASGAWLPRLGFRTLLRVAEAVPPVKRVLFAPRTA